jgi:hypothetical protein
MPNITETGLEAISDVRLFVYQSRHRLAIKVKYFNNLLGANRRTITARCHRGARCRRLRLHPEPVGARHLEPQPAIKCDRRLVLLDDLQTDGVRAQ